MKNKTKLSLHACVCREIARDRQRAARIASTPVCLGHESSHAIWLIDVAVDLSQERARETGFISTQPGAISFSYLARLVHSALSDPPVLTV